MSTDVPQFTTATCCQGEALPCDIRVLDSAAAAEVYLTASPANGEDAAHLYDCIARRLRGMGARIIQERLFADTGAIVSALSARAVAYRELDDGVPPTLLVTPGAPGHITGIQIHAVAGIRAMEVLRCGQRPCARAFQHGRYRWAVGSGIRAEEAGAAPGVQATGCFQNIETVLKPTRMDLLNVARTWIWVDRILDWYPELNKSRTAVFKERGMIGPAGRMPASTGIGVSPVGSARCAFDFFAVAGADDAVERYHAAGKQRSAYEYGSAFARAARARTPAGQTVFCSGTAAIDVSGATCFVNDPAGQVRMTINNVMAVLHEMQSESGDVVQAMAYCATAEVQRIFLEEWAPKLPWPTLTMMGDICRDDLLFEVEVTAVPGAKRLG